MDAQLYVHQMVSIKNLVLIADIQMSISVLRYQVDHRVLSIVTRVRIFLDSLFLEKKKLSVTGNRTPVSRELHQLMTGGDTYHYTITDLLCLFLWHSLD